MNAIRTPLRVLSAALMVLATLVALPSSASAEIVADQRASWGLKTKGASNTIGNWDALGWAVEQVGNTMFVGGNYLEVTNGGRTESQPYLAAFSADQGTFLPWWRPDVGGAVFAIEAADDGAIFVGGEMGTWNGTTYGGLMKIDPATGEIWPGWQTRVFGGASVVRDLKLEHDGWLYVGGGFTTASYQGTQMATDGLIRIDPDTGAIDTTWNPSIDGGAVWGISRSHIANEVHVAGFFTTVEGQTGISIGGFATFDDAGNAVGDRSIVPHNRPCNVAGYCTQLYDVEATPGGNLFVAGVEHALSVLDEATGDLIIHHYTGCNRNVTEDCTRRGGEFQEIEAVGNRIYATCHCWGDHVSNTVEPVMHGSYPAGDPTGRVSAVIAYDPVTGVRDQSFNPFMSGLSGGFAVHGNPSDGCLWVAGSINTVGDPAVTNPELGRDLVRLCDANGPGPAATPDLPTPTPAACTLTTDPNDPDAVTVTFDPSGVDGVLSTIVERRVDGANWAWRGRVDLPGTTFTDTTPADATTDYRVKLRFLTADFSDTTDCGTVDRAPADVLPVATCDATALGVDATVTWDAVDGAGDYRVFRSVNGSAFYWRGASGGDTTFTDILRAENGTTHTYAVAAVRADGSATEQTVCTPDLVTDVAVAGTTPPTTCDVTVLGGVATVTWAGAENATEYRIYRSVDGNGPFWRGKVTDTTFDDTMRTTPGTEHVYEIDARGPAGVWTERTSCAPSAITPAAVVVVAPASCDVTVVGTDAQVTWAAAEDANHYRIKRSADGGTFHWRGKVTDTTFSDPLRAGPSFTFTVEASADGNSWSSPVTCDPPVAL